MKSTLILWDSTVEPPEHEGEVYTWNGYIEKDSIHSLRQYVEFNGEELRRKYISFIHDLGESKVEGKQLKAHLDIEDGFSLWWMSLLAEKSIFKTPSIDTVIRIFALEEIVLQQKPKKFVLASANQSLDTVLSDFCHNLSITYEWKRLPNSSLRKTNLGRIYRALPHPAQALIILIRHAWSRWPLRKAEKSAWFKDSGSIFFCSYFAQMVSKFSDEGLYYSSYWGDLCVLMRKLRLSKNWLQHYYPHNDVPSPKVALDRVEYFNQQRQRDRSFHTFLDTYLSWGTILRVLKRWLRLMRIFLHLNDIKHAFRPHGSQLSLWPIMKEDWSSSMVGSISINNLLVMDLFDMVLSDLPHQTKGFYLCENISWERALIHAWRKHSHGQLIAVVHGVVRFWDMRYFHDLRTIRSSDSYSMLQPDLTVLNGKAAVDVHSSIGYPKEAIAEGEALRNNYLHDLRGNFSPRKISGTEIKVLVLTDAFPLTTIKMLKLLEATVLYAPSLASFTVKSHSLYTVKSSDYPSLKLKVTVNPLEDILSDFDIVYSSHETSASIDAYMFGLQVVVALSQTELNLSPLRGQPSVRFVSTPEELAEALQMTHQNTADMPVGNDFFFLDPELPRWHRLLTS